MTLSKQIVCSHDGNFEETGREHHLDQKCNPFILRRGISKSSFPIYQGKMKNNAVKFRGLDFKNTH
jgi:ABC-type sugar transport system ATPase subunit